MANREELAIIRNARAGQAAAQLELGKLYLFGSTGLPQSLPTALHWLERAAKQDCAPAWQLIGNHIPFELAQRNGPELLSWYQRAYDDGSVHAGLVFAQLVLDAGSAAPPDARAKALRALQDAARAGFAHAQWLLAQQQGPVSGAPATVPAPASVPAAPVSALRPAAPTSSPTAAAMSAPAPRDAGAPSSWLQRAAGNGVGAAQYVMLEQAWDTGQARDYLERALPLARELVQLRAEQGELRRFAPDEIALLSRCARLLDGGGTHGLAPGADEPDCFWELAAAEHDRHAQLAMGLRCARMQVDGRRIAGGKGGERSAPAWRGPAWHGPANFKKAIRWLTLAGEQGLAEAWYALSRIFIKPEFSQRNIADAQKYLERAAEMGYREAQLECGHNAWRARRENENNDVRAAYWLQKAAAQGSSEAGALLARIAPRPATPLYTETGALLAARTGAARSVLQQAHPLLSARLELAALFGLTRAEALLLDVKAADQGHCLVIDIRASYGRSKRRLVLVEPGAERLALDRIVRMFDHVDCGPSGPEGNYRQRLYRLRTVLGTAAAGEEDEAPGRPVSGAGTPAGTSPTETPGAGSSDTGAPGGTADIGLAA
ncbi:tetratricopeptide repeat protein [Massilia sp. DD77]|uniref:tetratricopeptide repeat protein n=1 Tax=Massilia sp. DD77 TaxID=3109349 RepID=UPI002FFDF0DE